MKPIVFKLASFKHIAFSQLICVYVGIVYLHVIILGFINIKHINKEKKLYQKEHDINERTIMINTEYT